MYDPGDRTNPLRSQEFFFWICALVALVSLLGRASFFGFEQSIAESAREAGEFGLWWPLCVNFRPFPGLPPLEVWSVAVMSFFGGINEFSGRLPSALAALTLIVGSRMLARMLFDRGTALLSSWMTLGCCGVLYLGRNSGSGVFSAALLVWTAVLYCEGAEHRGFCNTMVRGVLLTLGFINGGVGFLALAAALLLPWRWRRGTAARGSWGEAAAWLLTFLALYFSHRLLFGDPAIMLWTRLTELGGDGFAAAAKRIAILWWDSRSDPLYFGFCSLPRVIMPWALIVLAALAGAVWRFRGLPREIKSLLAGIGAGFVVLTLLPGATWTDYLALVPFLATAAAAELLRCGDSFENRWGVAITRGAIVLIAALGAVSPVALPIWKRLLNFDLPVVFLAACPITGAVVLFAMLLDSHPTRPLAQLSGLPSALASTILGGTLLTICLISFLIPSLRELRAEKPFLLLLKHETANFEPQSIIHIGGNSSASVVLFYTGARGAITVIPNSEGDPAGEIGRFCRLIASRPGGKFAIITRCRPERELAFLRRCAAAGGLKLDVDRPDRIEDRPPGYGKSDRRQAYWIVTSPLGGNTTASSNQVQEKGK